MQRHKTVLLIDETHKILQEKLKAKGYTVDFCPQYTYEDLVSCIDSYDALVVRSKVIIDKRLLDCAKNLKCIARSGAGMDAIDVEYAQSKGIVCLNSPEGNRDAVGEHTVGLLLCLLNKINSADSQVRNFLWQREYNRGLELNCRTVGIIGYGNMGKAFAKRLKGFGCKVIAYDKYLQNYTDEFAGQCTLKELYAEADILSLHVPLTDETKYMVNTEFINSFRKPFFLINTSRGKTVRLADLLQAMKQKKVLGCALDVLESESHCQQIESNESLNAMLKELFAMENTVFTPHVAGWTKESYYKLADTLADKIIKVLG